MTKKNPHAHPISTTHPDGASQTIEDVIAVAHQPEIRVSISEAAWEQMCRAAQAVQDFVARGEIVVRHHYQLQRVQRPHHLIGTGRAVAAQYPRQPRCRGRVLLGQPTTRAMMLIRANTLVKGLFGIREETLGLLAEMLNRGVYPLIPEQGSLGASSDLAPLAHMALTNSTTLMNAIPEGHAWQVRSASRLPRFQPHR